MPEPESLRAVIDVAGLSCAFGGRVAVEDVSFTVAGGEVVGLLGPNGAGKTTTMRALLGLRRPDAGHAVVHGSVGYLPEGYRGDDGLRVRAHLQFLATAKGMTADDSPAAVTGALAAVDATDLSTRPMSRLSRGQRQRVGLAQALLGDPAALVLDEPTAGLDPGQVRLVRDLLRSRAAAGTAVLVSTHLLAEAAATCDRIVVVARGRVVATERPDDIEDLEDRFLRLVAEAELS